METPQVEKGLKVNVRDIFVGHINSLIGFLHLHDTLLCISGLALYLYGNEHTWYSSSPMSAV